MPRIAQPVLHATAMAEPTERRNPSNPAQQRRLVIVAGDGALAERALPMLRAAVAMGLAVSVVTGPSADRAAIEASGARMVALDFEGGGLNPMTAGYAAGQLSAILKALKADIVHCIGLRAILVGGSAAAMAGIRARVYAPVGLAASGALARKAATILIRGPLSSGRTRYLVEDAAEVRALGLDPADTAVTLVTDGDAAQAVTRIYAELIGA